MSDFTLIFGGTFDPPHYGHLLLAECARLETNAGRVVWLPAGDPWRKAGRDVTPAADRVAMVRLAVAGNGSFVVDEREVRREGPTYTVETLRELRAEGMSDVTLILGSDTLVDFPNWREPEGILDLAAILVAGKPEGLAGSVGMSAEEAVATFLQRYAGARVSILQSMPQMSISSTLVRERVRAGLPVRYLVPDAVEEFIRRRGLYR